MVYFIRPLLIEQLNVLLVQKVCNSLYFTCIDNSSNLYIFFLLFIITLFLFCLNTYLHIQLVRRRSTAPLRKCDFCLPNRQSCQSTLSYVVYHCFSAGAACWQLIKSITYFSSSSFICRFRKKIIQNPFIIRFYIGVTILFLW